MKGKINSFKSLLLSEPNLAGFVTLFSFGTLARGLQFLIPLFIYSIYPSSKELDFYFYWCTQSNLIASFLSTIWPSALTSLIVKARAQKGDGVALQISALLLKRFIFFVTLVAVTIAFLAVNKLLGGPQTEDFFDIKILWGLSITILTTSLAVAISEVATAQRKFGILFQGLLASAIVQIITLALFKSRYVLELSFLLGCCSQLIFCLLQFRKQLMAFKKPAAQSLESLESVLKLTPTKRTVLLLYIGGIFTVLASHLSYRLLGDSQTGAVAAFAMASMLALAPQQLFIQHLSTVAGVAMTEAFHQSPDDFSRVSNNWKKRLFMLSLLLGLAVAFTSILALTVLPHLPFAKNSWQLVAGIMVFLSLPLAANGLYTWLVRYTVSIEKIEIGIWNQIVTNSITILLLFLCINNPLPFSTPFALALAALFQLISVPVVVKLLLK